MSAYGFCRRDVNKKYKTAGDSVDLVEVLAFLLWKSATLVTILYGRSRLRLNICSASHFIHASAYGYVCLIIKERLSDSLVRSRCWEVLANTKEGTIGNLEVDCNCGFWKLIGFTVFQSSFLSFVTFDTILDFWESYLFETSCKLFCHSQVLSSIPKRSWHYEWNKMN